MEKPVRTFWMMPPDKHFAEFQVGLIQPFDKTLVVTDSPQNGSEIA